MNGQLEGKVQVWEKQLAREILADSCEMKRILNFAYFIWDLTIIVIFL